MKDCLRKFLETAGVKQRQKGNSPLPQSAPISHVNTYEGGGGGGPVFPGILLNWREHLTVGLWNQDALTLLAVNAQLKLTEHQPSFHPDRLEQDFIKREIIKKLRNTKTKVNAAESLDELMLPDTARKITKDCQNLKAASDDQKKRRISRKHTVSVMFPY